MTPSTVILPDAAAVAGWAVDALLTDLAAALRAEGRASWVAAGGTTPLHGYRLLAERGDGGIAWEDVAIAMGDERCVPLDDPDSNWGQLRALLAGAAPFERATLLVPPVELGGAAAAERYAAALAALPSSPTGAPRLDHVWLGIGEDGHTLSLFPGHPAAEERARLVVPVRDSPKPPPERITLTLRALEGARHCAVLVAGAGKADALARALAGDEALPSARAAATVERAGGRVTWVVDAAAAAGAGARATAGP